MVDYKVATTHIKNVISAKVLLSMFTIYIKFCRLVMGLFAHLAGCKKISNVSCKIKRKYKGTRQGVINDPRGQTHSVGLKCRYG